MSRKRWKMRFSSRAAAAATLSAQSIAGRVRAMPTREPRNQPIFKSHHYLPPNKRLNDGTMKGALNPDEDRDRDFAQSFRPPCRQRQDQPAGSGPAVSPGYGNGKAGQAEQLAPAGFRFGKCLVALQVFGRRRCPIIGSHAGTACLRDRIGKAGVAIPVPEIGCGGHAGNGVSIQRFALGCVDAAASA